MTARQPRKWSVAEDQKLREEVEAQINEGEVKDWCRVAQKLPGRTNKDCRKRWLNSVAGGLKKGQWAKSEDVQLARGVEQFGQRWTLVAEVVGSRSADQCAKRWQQSLDPELDRSEWRESEDQILIEAVQRLGRHWKDIQRHHFPGRSKNCIKNRYTVIIRRYQNSGIPLPEGAGESEPSTPNNPLSHYPGPDDDNVQYSEDLYEALLKSPTQVSTPETNHSWPEPYANWTTHASANIPSTVGPTHFTTQYSAPAMWNWTTTSMEAPSVMNMAPTPVYAPNFVTQAPSYNTYSAMQGVMAHHTRSPSSGTVSRSGFPVGAPTSSPRLPMAHTAAYQDPDAINRYRKAGMQGDQPPYRY